MIIETDRLILRKWQESDAESLLLYGSNPNVGPAAGWSPIKDIENSIFVINKVLNGAECYAICEKGKNTAIGAIELMKYRHQTEAADNLHECELGFWIGEPFWGRGYVPEAADALIKRAFTVLRMKKIWCGYYDGNIKSKRVQEKLGFVYDHTEYNVPVPLLNDIRTEYFNILTADI